jgi:signal transduction histidine kinase/CheY-like chemotaxis protein
MSAWWEKAYPEPTLRLRAQTHWAEVAQAAGTTIPPSEYAVTTKGGGILQLEIQAAVIGDQWLLMFTDVSERRRNEDAMRQTQKLESLGVLAGGIAHDFNNLLSAMLGNLNMAQMKQPIGAASGPYLENMESTIRKAAELTRQMLAYSGKGRFVVEPLDLSQLVGEITHLLAVSISKRVRVEYDLAPDLPAIEADAVQLQQIVMNLVTNASEAMGEADGTIRVSTSVRDLQAGELGTTILGQALEAGRYVCLRVEDTGCGMEGEVQSRIFDPFYSTKGSGRGLGLSAMLGILRGHQAGIEIQSEPGKGSLFQVYFRASTAEAASDAVQILHRQRPRFEGKVLLVDDEPELRFSYASMLQHLGFQVVAARDGVEALERFQQGSFVLVFMDLTMPRMDGQEAFLKLKALDPDVRVILASGYSEGEAVEALQEVRPAAFIQKPFSFQAMTAVLEKVLG